MAKRRPTFPLRIRQCLPGCIAVGAAILPLLQPAGAVAAPPATSLCARFEMPPPATPQALRDAIRFGARTDPLPEASRAIRPRALPTQDTRRPGSAPGSEQGTGCAPQAGPRWWQDPPAEPSGLIGMTRFERVAPLGTTLMALASVPGVSLGDRPFSTFPPAPPPQTAAPQPVQANLALAKILLVESDPVAVIVPEPEAVALLLAGLAGLAVAARRRTVRVRRRR